MTRADIIAMANDAREIATLASGLPGTQVRRQALVTRAERIAARCDAALAAQASGHEPMVELFGDAPTAQEGRE